MLNALNTTDKLDALYKRGRTSAEFISAATPIEGIFVNLHKKLTRGDPGAIYSRILSRLSADNCRNGSQGAGQSWASR
jgi:hypothetical protein